MFRLTTLLAIATLSTGSAVFAGDTVTVNVPGGATQGALTIGVASNFQTQVGGNPTPGGVHLPAGPTGSFTVNMVGGGSYTTSSLFVANLLSVYAPPSTGGLGSGTGGIVGGSGGIVGGSGGGFGGGGTTIIVDANGGGQFVMQNPYRRQ